MLFHSLRFPWKTRLLGVATVVPLVAAWWIPTAERYGGVLLSFLRYSGQQVEGLAQGLFAGHIGLHAFVNGFHAGAGTIMTWGLLLPAVCLGAAAGKANATARSMTIFMVPGLVFFVFYFVSDATYFAYMAAAGMVLAGIYLGTWPAKTRDTAYAVAVGASLLFMIFARPVDGKASKRLPINMCRFPAPCCRCRLLTN